MESYYLLYLAGVPFLGILAQWLAWYLRIPAILLLLVLGLSLGTFIHPDMQLAELIGQKGNPEIGITLMTPLISLAVAVILFEGGLTLKFSELQDVGNVVFRLCSVGVVVCWGLTACLANLLLGFDFSMAALLGAILVVTGPTVISPLLRFIQPARKLGSIVKWEGIVVDPVGALLAVLIFQVIAQPAGSTGFELVSILFHTAFISVFYSWLAGAILVYCVKRYWVPDYLQGVVFLTVALAIFALSDMWQKEAGLATVTLFGIYLANQKDVSLKHVLVFKEHLVVLFISCLFIVLGSRLNVLDLWKMDSGELLRVGGSGILFLLLMIFLVRPISVIVATIGTPLTIKERLFVSFLAPRGIVAAAVASVFALEISHLAHDHEGMSDIADQAAQLVPITFLVIIGTVAFYGLASGLIARKLGVALPNPQGLLIAGSDDWVRSFAKLLDNEGLPILLIDTNHRHVSEAKMAGLQAHCVSILSEYVHEELDLAGIGKMVLLTSNDEVNSLALQEGRHLFGTENVYQITPWDSATGRRESVADRLKGRLLFKQGYNYYHFKELFAKGYRFKRTQITEEFSYEAFQKQYEEEVILCFVIEENQKLLLNTVERQIEPKAGQVVITMVPREIDSPEQKEELQNSPSSSSEIS